MLADTLDRALALQAEVAGRLGNDGAENALSAKLVMMHYEAAPPGEKRAAGRAAKRGRKTG
jgi:hypothetical protein